MTQIANDLVEAYKGVYEDEMAGDLTVPMEEPEHETAWVEAKIRSHTPKERLAVYLQWNGILGWTERIWDISQGKFTV